MINDFGNSWVAYDLNKSLMHELNESAYFILQQIEMKKTEAQIVKLMIKKFETTEAQASLDFAQFLKTLKSMEIIE